MTARMARFSRNCAMCGILYEVLVNNLTSKFHNASCYHRWQKANKKMPPLCLGCGNPTEHISQRCISCRSERSVQLRTHDCVVCGTPTTNQKVCSTSCRGKLNKGKSFANKGRPLSQEHKDALQKTYDDQTRNPIRHTYGNGGFRPDIGHYVRSSWEANYARVLIQDNIEYIYEPKGLKCDFLVPQWNLAIEIKPDHRWNELDKFWKSVNQTTYTGYVLGSCEYEQLREIYGDIVYWE